MSEDVAALLEHVHQDEIETVMNYMINSTVLNGVRAEETKESLQTDIQEELTHAEQLGNRLKQLDEQPPDSASLEVRQYDLQPPENSMDALAVINDVLMAGEDAIETHRALIDAAEEANNPIIEDLAVTVLADEEAHRTEFRGSKKEHDRE